VIPEVAVVMSHPRSSRVMIASTREGLYKQIMQPGLQAAQRLIR
jgi:hypothetical protein